MICIDRFSKMIQLVSLKKSDAATVTNKFVTMVVSWHGLPEYIMSNYDPHFCGHFWDELMFLLNMTLTFSMASYPQTDRIAEVMNYTMK